MKKVQLPGSLSPALVVVASILYTTAVILLTLISLMPAANAATETRFSNISNAQQCSNAARLATLFSYIDHTAIKYCNIAIRSENLRDHDLAATYNNRGVLFKKLSRHSKALRDYYSARNLKREFVASYVNIGNVFYIQQEFEKAVRFYDKALDSGEDLRPSSESAAYINRALAREQLGFLEAARLDYQSALELDVHSEKVHEHLQRLDRGSSLEQTEDGLAIELLDDLVVAGLVSR